MKTTIPALLVAAVLVASAVGLAACGGGSSAKELKDGTYTGQSAVYEDEDDGNGNGYGVVTITIEDGAITEAEFLTYEVDGTLKDEDYGKAASGAIMNQDFYNKAQRAVEASKGYAEQLVEVGNAADVDVVSGATISYNEFQEAVEIALAEASR